MGGLFFTTLYSFSRLFTSSSTRINCSFFESPFLLVSASMLPVNSTPSFFTKRASVSSSNCSNFFSLNSTPVLSTDSVLCPHYNKNPHIGIYFLFIGTFFNSVERWQIFQTYLNLNFFNTHLRVHTDSLCFYVPY